MADVTDPRIDRLVDAFLAESRLTGAVELDPRVAYGIVSQLVRATCTDKGVTIDSALDDHLTVEVVRGLVRLGAAGTQDSAAPSRRALAVSVALCGEVVSTLAQVVTRTTRAAADYSVPLHRATGTLLSAAGTIATFAEALRPAAAPVAGPGGDRPAAVMMQVTDLREAATVLDACAVVITESLPFGRRADEDQAQLLAAALRRAAGELVEIDRPTALPK